VLRNLRDEDDRGADRGAEPSGDATSGDEA